MAIIHPFRAWRPTPEAVKEVACVPYDVINTQEAKELSEGKPNSFLHVIRPEIDLPKGTFFNDNSVYEKGKENLYKLLDSDVMTQEDEPGLYVYELVMKGRSQTGLFSCVAVEDYDNDVILKHELTRPDKEDDRTRHIVTQKAHAEPVMLTFKDHKEIFEAMSDAKKADPLYDFIATDGVEHRIWKMDNPEQVAGLFSEVDHLYVADGHHRCKSASRAVEELGGTDEVSHEVNFFPAVLFPMSEMEILSYNRIIFDASEDTIQRLLVDLEATKVAYSEPKMFGEVCIYSGDGWYSARLPKTQKSGVANTLDVARLGEFVLEPVFNITDPRRDQNISFVGGIRGTQELEKHVDSGNAALAISMYPTSIEELVDVSDAGELMPPKSTWFEPKLRSGLLVHTF
jgi:uncharacterized protein (DUF1015 family)